VRTVSATQRRLVGLLTLLLAVLYLAVCCDIATAGTVTVGKPTALSAITSLTTYEPSATNASDVRVECTAGTDRLVVDGVEVETLIVPSSDEGSMSSVLGAGQKYAVEITGSTCKASTSLLEVTGVTGPEGKEGKEGKEGPKGETGPKGEAGAAGGGEVTKFGPEAVAEIDGDTETLEDSLFALLGTVLFVSVFFVLLRALPGRPEGSHGS
jgi:hypothetical protein